MSAVIQEQQAELLNGVPEEPTDTPTGPTDAAWMIALLLVFAVAVGYFFVNVVQFHLLPH